MSGQAVGPRQIDEIHLLVIGQPQPPHFSLDRHAGIISDMLKKTGKTVKKRGLTGIGIANESDGIALIYSGLRSVGQLRGHASNLKRSD